MRSAHPLTESKISAKLYENRFMGNGADKEVKAQTYDLQFAALSGNSFVCLFCCFTSQSTALVMGGRSIQLTTLFPGQA